MALEILMPALSPTMEEGTLSKWLVSEGDVVQSGDLLAEIETDKATMEFEAVEEGIISKLLVAEGTANVKVNSAIAILLEDSNTERCNCSSYGPDTYDHCDNSADSQVSVTTAPVAANGTRIFISPLAKRIAANKGLNLATITGTGPKGRIVKADLINAASTADIAAPSPNMTILTSTNSAVVEAIYRGRAFKTIPLDGMRKVIAARLTEAKQTIPHFYLRRDIHLDKLLKARIEINRELKERGVKTSVNDFIIKACALALQKVPRANAVWAGDRVSADGSVRYFCGRSNRRWSIYTCLTRR